MKVLLAAISFIALFQFFSVIYSYCQRPPSVPRNEKKKLCLLKLGC